MEIENLEQLLKERKTIIDDIKAISNPSFLQIKYSEKRKKEIIKAYQSYVTLYDAKIAKYA
jgi:hypothetical protein